MATQKQTKSPGLSVQQKNRMPAQTFAFPRERKEPLNDARHVRNAIARFDQVEGVSDQEQGMGGNVVWQRLDHGESAGNCCCVAGKKVPFGVVDERDLATRSDRVDRNAGSNGLRPSHSRAIAVHQDVDRQRGALAVKPADGIAPAHAGAVVFREGERDILSWQVLEPRQCRTAELDPPHPRRDTVGGGDGQLPAGRLRQGHGLVLPKRVR